MPLEEALDKARDNGFDLVEVSPNTRPPVCRILDYGKFKYELAKKDKISKKKQHNVQLKEMRYRPKIDGHDFDFKTKHVREFIESGNKVKVFVMFRGREMAYQEFGAKVLERIREELEDVTIVEVKPKMEGRNMNMMLAPNAEVMKKVKLRTKDKEKTREVNEDSNIVATSETESETAEN